MFSRFFERSDLPLSEGELQIRRRKVRRIFFLIGAVLVLAVAGYFSARPTVNAVRAWQARRHAQKAFAFIDQQKWTEARTEAVAAYQLRSTEPQAIRAVARLLSRAGQTDALTFWKELRARGKLTRTDLRDEAAVALKGARARCRRRRDQRTAQRERRAAAVRFIAGRGTLDRTPGSG